MPGGRLVTDAPERSGNGPDFTHVPVMRGEVVEWFRPVPPGWIIDATLGGAGHARAVLDAHPHLSVLGIDRDPAAVQAATDRLAPYGDRARVVRARFDELAGVARDLDVSGVLFDLGVSSVQFDQAERGFSYRADAPLDMRMDPTSGLSAADLLATASVDEISRILRDYGDERFAFRIAQSIVRERNDGSPVRTTSHLVQLVTASIPAATRRTGGHPAKRTFQAIRIAVNGELDVLAPALDAAIDALLPDGRLVVISYHSGEDRIVKERIRLAETGGCTCPPGLPCTCGALPRGRALRRSVTRPSEAEAAVNRRASSALARVFLKSSSASSAHTPDANAEQSANRGVRR